jgi:hypothetical protein
LRRQPTFQGSRRNHLSFGFKLLKRSWLMKTLFSHLLDSGLLQEEDLPRS